MAVADPLGTDTIPRARPPAAQKRYSTAVCRATGLSCALAAQALLVAASAGLALAAPAWASIMLVAAGFYAVGGALGAGGTRRAGRRAVAGVRTVPAETLERIRP
jgi:hypothetical protein